jgi:hypothetical protein
LIRTPAAAAGVDGLMEPLHSAGRSQVGEISDLDRHTEIGFVGSEPAKRLGV